MTTVAERPQLAASTVTHLTFGVRGKRPGIQGLVTSEPIAYGEKEQPIKNILGEGSALLMARLLVPAAVIGVGRAKPLTIVQHVAPGEEGWIIEVIGSKSREMLGSCALGEGLIIGRDHAFADELDELAPKMPYGMHPVSRRHGYLYVPEGSGELHIVDESANGMAVEHATSAVLLDRPMHGPHPL